MKEQLINYIQKNTPQYTEITEYTLLLEDNILDSLGIIDLICFIENTFSISIPDSEFDIKNFKDIQSIVNLITKLQ